ncbi:MAG: type III pantothenate kinase [Actinomycetota bacterium]
MLLAVDVGNTQTVIGLFDRGELERHWRIATDAHRTGDELALIFGGLMGQAGLSFGKQVTGVAVSSVVPQVTETIRDMCERYFHFPPMVVGPGLKTGLMISTDNPREVGADRVVNAVAAFARFHGSCIVIDFGTATTVDAIGPKGEYLGGAIAPGIEISTQALVRAGAQLRTIAYTPPRSVIGKTTVEAIQSGVLYGFAGQVEGIVRRMREILGEDTPVIATGGSAGIIAPICPAIDVEDPWLTLQGLQLLYERNAGER